MCGLGGDLFAIVHAPGAAPVTVLGAGVAPRAATLEQMRAAGPQTPSGAKMPTTGPLSIGVPGMIDGYDQLHRRYATKPIAELAQAAIRYAEDGAPMTPMCQAATVLHQANMRRFQATADLFLPGGQPMSVGAVLRQPGLAATLKRLASVGLRDFYDGEIARRMARAVQDVGGALSAEDLALHETVFADPISASYRGYTVYQTAPPSQGMILLEALNIVENAAPDLLARNDAAAIHILAEACKIAYADRIAHAVEPNFGATPLNILLSKAHAKQRFSRIGDRAAEEVDTTLSDGDTTYLCVIDGSGMMVSWIQSVSSAFGSTVVAGDTGIVMNNRVGRGFNLTEGHPNIFAPGKKTMSTLNLYSLADSDGVAIGVGGTPGGDGQPQWNLQTLVALIDGGMDIQSAIDTPRWSIWPGTDPANHPNPYELQVETRLSPETLAGLQVMGHRLKRMGEWGAGGAAQLIIRDPKTGILAGGSDPRSEGMALGY